MTGKQTLSKVNLSTGTSRLAAGSSSKDGGQGLSVQQIMRDQTFLVLSESSGTSQYLRMPESTIQVNKR